MTGLAVARVVFGLLMAAHGAQKLFGWFGGHGLTAVSGIFEVARLPSRPALCRRRGGVASSPAACSSRSDCSGRSGRR